jgi:GNAT superfamily N-acetyltransferase
VNAGEIALWTRTLVAGFFERTELTLEELAIGDSLAAMHGAGAFLAEVDGRAAAAATARVHQKLISLFGDSTLPEFRGKGLQPALIRARLLWAAEQECTLATAATLPGTVSQRNYQREGFQVAYTKMNMQREW